MSPRARNNGKAHSNGELNGFLDSGTQIVDGELRFKDTFRVDGRLVGRVSSDGDLIVGRGSTVEGQIRVGRLFVSGIVKGSVQAERVEIAPGARVEADVETPSLLIAEGGKFQGRCVMEIQPVRE
jgi:cytoskeletal protein CcmA (bactofilin family)